MHVIKNLDFDHVTPANAREIQLDLKWFVYRLEQIVQNKIDEAYYLFDKEEYRKMCDFGRKVGFSALAANTISTAMRIDNLDFKEVQWAAGKPSETRTVSDFKSFWDPKYHAPPTFSHSNATQAAIPRPRATQ